MATLEEDKEFMFKVQDVILKDGDTSATATVRIMQLIKARDEQREKALLDELMDTARSYHEEYPDADYFDFAGLVAGMRRGSNPQEQDQEVM